MQTRPEKIVPRRRRGRLFASLNPQPLLYEHTLESTELLEVGCYPKHHLYKAA